MTAVRTEFELLPFYCPIDSAIHPLVDEVERGALAWVDSLPLPATDVERAWIAGTNSAEFYARFAPYGDPYLVQLAARWVYFGFAFDDARCDAGEHSRRPERFLPVAGAIQRALEIPGDPPDGADRFTVAVHDIGRAFREHATPTQVRRFAEAHRRWLLDVAWQVGNRSRGYMPDLNEYTAMRLGSCGGPPTFAMLEIANGAEVPAKEMDSLPVRALTELACLVAGWDNDLHSYRKEADRDHSDQNIVNVLVRRQQLPLPEALLTAVRMRDRAMSLFLRLRERALRRASQELTDYLTCLGHGIRGNIDWALRVPRYTSPATGDGAPVAAPAWASGWADRPADTSADPLPIPAIAWWWQLER
ncbi:terpene synthase family protein [Actinomycetes bacterium KLBMP 9797]